MLSVLPVKDEYIALIVNILRGSKYRNVICEHCRILPALLVAERYYAAIIGGLVMWAMVARA